MPTTPLGTWLTSTRVRPGTTPSRRSGVEVPVGGAGVVAGGQRDVERLVEGVLAGLAGLPHDQVDDLVLAVEHQVVQPQQHRRALVERASGPRPPGRAGRGAKASATSSSLDCGTWASGAPVSGVSTRDRAAPTSRRSRAGQRGRRSSGSRAYDAVGSCSGSAGPSTSGSAGGVGFGGTLIYREYVTRVSLATRVANVALDTSGALSSARRSSGPGLLVPTRPRSSSAGTCPSRRASFVSRLKAAPGRHHARRHHAPVRSHHLQP